MTKQRFLAAILVTLSGVTACADSKRPTDPDTTGNGATTWDTSTVVSASPVIRMSARDNVLYSLDDSDTPLKRLSLASGERHPLFSSVPVPQAAVSDGMNVYWSAKGSVFRTPSAGGPTELLASGERDAVSGATAQVVLDETHVYFVNSVATGTCTPACTFTIRRVPKAGGAAVTVATASQVVVGIAVSGSSVFWEERGLTTDAEGTTGSAIRKAPVTGGAITTVVNGLLNGLKPPPPSGTVAAAWRPVGGLEVDASHIYFGDTDAVAAYRILRVAVDGGTVTPLADISASADNVVRDLELDAAHVYWVDKTSLRKVAKTGGPVSDLAGTLSSPVSLDLIGTTLFWVETSCCAHGQKGTVRKVGAAGGTPQLVKSDIDSPISVVASASSVFLLEGGAIGEVEGFGRIARTSHTGEGVAVLVESVDVSSWSTQVPRPGGFFDVDASHVYFVDRFTIKRVPIAGGVVERVIIGDANAADVATDGVHVYWVESGLATVRRVPVNGGSATTIASGNGKPMTMALDATHVYWSIGESAVIRAPKEGGMPTSVTGEIAGGLTDFVVAGGQLYFSGWDSGELRSVSVAGGQSVLLRSLDADQTRRIAVDGNRLFWVDQRDVGYIATTGSESAYIVRDGISSNPFLAGDIAVHSGRVYWSEVADAIIKRAVPK